MVVRVPTTPRAGGEGADGDAGKAVEYATDDVQDMVLQAVLKQAYAMFVLFHGPLVELLAAQGREGLVASLDLFLTKYLATVEVDRADIIDAFDGIQFLPLDKNTYLKTQCFVNLVEATFEPIKHSVFLYRDMLVASGLEQEDMRVLYRYLVGGLMSGEPAASAEGGAAACRFLIGPEDVEDRDNTPINTPQLYVKEPGGGTGELHLVIYQCNGVKVCFLVERAVARQLAFYKRLSEFIKPHLLYLDQVVREQQSRRSASALELEYRYLYFNHMNLAQKSSFMVLPKRPGGPAVSSVAVEYIRYLTDMHESFSGLTCDSEIIVKTPNDCWLVGRKSDQREFFVILSRGANLIEIADEIRRMSSEYFGKIFFDI